MTTNRRTDPSDARLEEMLRQRAGDTAPRDLVAAIASAIDVTPQGPRHLRTRLAPRESGRGNAGLLLVAAALVTTAFGAAIVGGTKLTTPDQSRTINGVVETPASSIVTRSPSPPTPAVPAVAHDFSMEPHVTPHLVTDDIGWVATPTSLYRTTDGGHTWADLTPPHPGSSIASSVVDADTAVVTWGSGHGISIAWTRDAGASWTTSNVDDSGAWGPVLQVTSATDGILTFFDKAEVAPARVHVYSTTDGGWTWAGPTAGTFPVGEIKPGGWGGGAIWLNVGKADNVPFDNRLWLSTDGGVTWPARRFPTASFVKAGDLKWVSGPPILADGSRIVINISNGDTDGVFRSDDNGQTWRLLKSAVEPRGAYDPLHLSADTWMLVSEDGTSVLSSTDAGEHWRTVTGDHPIRFLGNPTFASPDHGWAEHGCDRGTTFHLNLGPDPLCDGNARVSFFLETTDGGKTWHQFASNGG
jgi:photosystem II stability/assembly factor-like uncharacterized protein